MTHKTPCIQRRDFVKLAGAAGMLAAAGQITSAATSSTLPAKPLIDGTPAVFAPTATSATIVWTVNAPARGWVEYGTSENNLSRKSADDGFGFVPHDERILKVRLDNLAPGTRYWWRAVTEPLTRSANPTTAPATIASHTYSFSTLSPAAAETHFAMWNDTHSRAETIAKLAALTSASDAPRPDFLLWNGDIVSASIENPAVIPGVYVHASGAADLAAGPAILHTRGNHDVRGLWANKLGGIIDFPGSRPYYAFRSGPLGAIVLDTGEDKPDAHPGFRGTAAFESLIAEQARWLEKIIERPDLRDAPVKVVFCHIPLRWLDEKTPDYNKGGYDWFSKRGRDAWHASLVKWGARAILSGHTHEHAHLPATQEFPYAQIIGGGPDLKNARLIRGHCTNKELRITIHALDGAETAPAITI